MTIFILDLLFLLNHSLSKVISHSSNIVSSVSSINQVKAILTLVQNKFMNFFMASFDIQSRSWWTRHQQNCILQEHSIMFLKNLKSASWYDQWLIACKTLFSAHSGIVGLVIAPMMLLGGPLVLRAAAYTAGTVAALSLTSACAPDEKFLTWGGPLSLALGGICVACIGELCVLLRQDSAKKVLFKVNSNPWEKCRWYSFSLLSVTKFSHVLCFCINNFEQIGHVAPLFLPRILSVFLRTNSFISLPGMMNTIIPALWASVLWASF